MCAQKRASEDLSSLKAKMRTTPYHFNLLSDTERLSAFLEAIRQKAKGTVYDIGAGCGILSILAAPYSNFIYAVEKDSRSAKLAESNFKLLNNILLINEDARNVIFEDKADLIICEMLDTALIDEEQVPVINSILKYLKEDGEIIPYGILNGVEAIYMDRNSICYDDEFDSSGRIYHEIISNLVIYNEFNFKNLIKEDVETEFELKICKKSTFSGIKITTFTLLTDNIICGPTPMLNPPLLIPTQEINVDIGDTIKVRLSYKMGGGLDSVQTRVKKIS